MTEKKASTMQSHRINTHSQMEDRQKQFNGYTSLKKWQLILKNMNSAQTEEKSLNSNQQKNLLKVLSNVTINRM